MTARPPVVITGMGAICALGDAPAAVYDALCAGQSGFGPPSVFGADVAAGHLVAEVPNFNPQTYIKTGNVRPLDRTGRLALVAVNLTLADSGWTPELRSARPLGLILGTMFCSVRTIGEFDRRAQQAGVEYASPMDFSNTVLNAAAGQVAIWEKLRGINTTISTGAASGVHAIGYAMQMIRTGRADALLAGGAEELCYESFHGARQAGRLLQPNGASQRPLPFDEHRNGTAVGEGAAFLTLESAETAAARGARVVGRVSGFSSGYDPDSISGVRRESAPHSALAAAIVRALNDAGIAPSDVGFVVASANGGRDLDAREGASIVEALGRSVPVTAIKSMTGDALGASGALQALTALQALRSGRLPGIAGLTAVDPAIGVNASAATRDVRATHALVTAIAPEGNCGALVLSVD